VAAVPQKAQERKLAGCKSPLLPSPYGTPGTSVEGPAGETRSVASTGVAHSPRAPPTGVEERGCDSLRRYLFWVELRPGPSGPEEGLVDVGTAPYRSEYQNSYQEAPDLNDPALRSDLMKRLGSWLKRHGISQTTAAKRLSLHRGHLSNLIRGEHVPNEGICRAAIRYMTGSVESSPRADASESSDLTDGEQIVAELRDIATGKTPPPGPEDEVTVAPIAPVEVATTPVPEPVKAPRVQYRRPLCAAEVTAVGSIVRAVIETRPGMTADDLIEVTKAVVEGLR
jgi:transcriptional regulator with XRE-family HTH domain